MIYKFNYNFNSKSVRKYEQRRAFSRACWYQLNDIVNEINIKWLVGNAQ